MIGPTHQRITLGFMLAGLALVIAYDVAINLYCGEHATISRTLLKLQIDHPIAAPTLTFAAGVAIGHIFFPQYVR